MRVLWPKTKVLWLAVFVALGAGAGCGGQQTPADPPQPKPAVKPVPATPIAKAKVELGEQTWNPAWSKLIETSLPRKLLARRRARQVGALCPRFGHVNKADRRVFWAYFFQALAGAEAGLEPTVVARHTEPAVAVIDPVTGLMTRQEGLLQLTYMDSKRYGCNFDWQKDKGLPEHDPARTILQPRNNLLCGINILDDQLVTHREPLLSPKSYWSTLRPGTVSFRVFMKQMANVPDFCLTQRELRRREELRGKTATAVMTASAAPAH